MKLEEVFSSRGRIKIIKELIDNRDGLLITELGRKVHLNHSTITLHLNALVEGELIRIHRLAQGRIKQIRLIDNVRTRALRSLFMLWDNK